MTFQVSSSPANIFLHLSNPAEERMVRQLFPDRYQFNTSCDLITSNHDLAIVDLKYFRKVKSDLMLLKEELDPVFLPTALVARQQVSAQLQPDDWSVIDDFFTTPISKKIIRVRVNNLLRIRRKSIDLKKKNNLSHKAINSLDAGIVFTDPNKDDNPITFCNEGFEKMTGYSRDEVLGKNCRFLQKDDREQEELHKIRQAVTENRNEKVLLRNYRKDGTRFWNELSIAPIKDEEGQNEFFVGIQNDVSDLVNARERLEQLLKEKNTLLKEIHHRIKNNLAVIVALLELKILDIDSAEVKQTLHETKDRIFSIAKVHELLYEHENLHSIRFDIYIEKLTNHLRQTYISDEKDIEFKLVLEKAKLNLNQAVPCGMLLSELITNSIKHAFNNKSEGQVKIILHESDGYYHLRVTDTGDGVISGSELETSIVTDKSITKTLLNQLDAEWSAHSEDGLEFSFHFKAESYTGPSEEL